MPTKYMKKNDTHTAIYCHPNYGPFFWEDVLVISDKGDKEKCWTNNNCRSYECDPEYKRSLFVNTSSSNHTNDFNILDYEVFAH